MNDPEREAVERIRALLRGQRLAVLGTREDDAPHLSVVFFAASPDLRTLYFATRRQTRKAANLAAYPRASLLIDDRTHSSADVYRACTVLARGDVRELDGAEREAARAAYVALHPHLADFVGAPTCVLFAMTVSTCTVVNRFQNVVEVEAGAWT